MPEYHYSIASALQYVPKSLSRVSINTLVRITLCSYKNVVFVSAMMSRISIHIHSVVLVERKPGFLMVQKLCVLYKVINGQNTHMQSGCDVCNLFRKLYKGRYRKQRNKSGCPFNGSSQSIANGILHNAPVSWKSATSLSPSWFIPSTSVPLI